MCVSESEYTNAGEVMQKVGKVEQKDSMARLVPPSLSLSVIHTPNECPTL